MQYDKDQFIWDVINEAIALRNNATKKERKRLNIQILAPMSEYSCIYGLMTGSCFSTRATELIAQCCPKFFYPSAVSHGNSIEQIIINSDGRDANKFAKTRSMSSDTDTMPGPMLYSAIEAYITLHNSDREGLIAYLRGESETLDIYF